MARKILTGTLITVSSLLLLLSVVGIVLAWVYNEPVTRESLVRLEQVDDQLAQIQTDLQNAQAEVKRALRIIQSAEEALASLAQQTTDANKILEQVNSTLDDDLIPGLVSTRLKIIEVRGILEGLRNSLAQLNTLPFVNLNIPGDELLTSIISGVDTLDAEIVNVQDLAQRASVFISDTSYLLGGDFMETKEHLQNLLQVLEGYDQQVDGWRAQIAAIIESVPRWVDNASISLTVGLLWFGFSQFGLLLHGLSLRRGDDPLEVLRDAYKSIKKK